MEVHLPCPPLDDWLARRASGLRVGAWSPSRAPRRLRATLARWPRVVCEAELSGLEPEALDVFMFGTTLEHARLPEPQLGALRSGTWIIELAAARARPLRALLGLGPRPLQRAAAGQARALAWISRGLHGVEQWESLEPTRVIVTLGRVR